MPLSICATAALMRQREEDEEEEDVSQLRFYQKRLQKTPANRENAESIQVITIWIP